MASPPPIDDGSGDKNAFPTGGSGDGNVFVRDPSRQNSFRLASIKHKPGAKTQLAPAEINAETVDHQSIGDSGDSPHEPLSTAGAS